MFRFTILIAWIIFMTIGPWRTEPTAIVPFVFGTLVIVALIILSYIRDEGEGKKYLLFRELFRTVSYQRLFLISFPVTTLSVYLIGKYYHYSDNNYEYLYPLFILAFSVPVMIKCIRLSYLMYCQKHLPVAESEPSSYVWTTTAEDVMAEAKAKRLVDVQKKIVARKERQRKRAESDEHLADTLMYLKLIEGYVNSPECKLKEVFARNFNWLPGDHSFYKISASKTKFFIPNIYRNSSGDLVLSIRRYSSWQKKIPDSVNDALRTISYMNRIQINIVIMFFPDERMSKVICASVNEFMAKPQFNNFI